MDDLRVGAGVRQGGDRERQEPARGGVGRRVGEGEGDTLVIEDPVAALFALHRPVAGHVEQPPHRADAAGGDAEALLHEPGALQIVPAADTADHVGFGDLDVGEGDRRVAVGIHVREEGVVDRLDAGTLIVDHEQGRELLAVVDHVGHDDVDGGDVAGGHEPLLTVEQPAVARVLRRRGGRDPARVGPGVALGHRVGVADLAAQQRLQPALGVLGPGVLPDVVAVRDVPVDGVGRAPVLLLDQRPLQAGPALTAVVGVVEPAGEPTRDRLALDIGDDVVGQPAVASLGLLLEREEDLLGERASAGLDVARLLVEIEGDVGRVHGGDSLSDCALHLTGTLTCD